MQIDFISLERTLEAIAGRLRKPEEMDDLVDLVECWRYSQAAATLHELFLNYPDRAPRWVVLHEVTGRPIFNDAIAAEGMDILVYLSGWFDRQRKFRSGNAQFHAGSPPESDEELWKTAHLRKYRWGTMSRSYAMGFNRADVRRLLVEARIPFSHRLGDDRSGTAPVPAQPEPRPQPSGQHAEDPIVHVEPIGEAPDHAAGPLVGTIAGLTLPLKPDTWAKVIKATYDILVCETRAAPSSLEVWLRLNHKPPANYPVTATRDRGLAAIQLPGEKPLTRDGFNKRWRRYAPAD